MIQEEIEHQEYLGKYEARKKRFRIMFGFIALGMALITYGLGITFQSFQSGRLEMLNNERDKFFNKREELQEKIKRDISPEISMDLKKRLEIIQEELVKIDEYIDGSKKNYANIKAVIPLLAFTFLTVGLVYFAWLYLQGTLTSQKKAPAFRGEIETSSLRSQVNDMENRFKTLSYDLQNKIKSFDKQISSIGRDIDISDYQKNEIVDNLVEKMKSEASDMFLKDIEKKVEYRITDLKYLSQLDEQFTKSFDRLNSEISSLARRGNLNLVLGIFTTIIGLAALGVFVWKIEYQPNQHWYILETFLPRLSLVILIELFAYFFLKLYKSSLSEIKYFQNEISNFEAKYVALRLAFVNKDRTVFDEVLKTLSGTERNYILAEGQSTIDLERQKLEKETVSKIIDSVSGIVKNIGKK